MSGVFKVCQGGCQLALSIKKGEDLRRCYVKGWLACWSWIYNQTKYKSVAVAWHQTMVNYSIFFKPQWNSFIRSKLDWYKSLRPRSVSHFDHCIRGMLLYNRWSLWNKLLWNSLITFHYCSLDSSHCTACLVESDPLANWKGHIWKHFVPQYKKW